MKKREAPFTTKLIKWLDKNFNKTCAIEVKVSKDDKIYLNQFAPHQLRNLKMVKHNKIIWKIPDAGWQNPFDIMMYSKSEAYVCMVFNIETEDEEFCIIDIDKILNCKQKSLTLSQCKALSIISSSL